MIQRHYINGIEVNAPLNYKELEIELNYDQNGNSQALSSNTFDWGIGDNTENKDGFTFINDHFEKGNVFEGLPHRIDIDSQNGKVNTEFNGYIDVRKTVFAHDKITATTTEIGKLDWLAEMADSKSFTLIQEEGFITKDDYIQIPYCINKKQSSFETLITAISIFAITDKLQEQITDISEKTASASNPFEATVIIRLIFRILYIVILLSAIISLLIQIFRLLVQPVKYHAGMYVVDLIEKGLKSFGLTLSSSILQKAPFNQMAILPEKYTQIENTGLFASVAGLFNPNNSNETGYYNGTLGQLLDAMKLMFHARIIILDNVLYFEKFAYETSSPKYTLPDLWDARHEFELNTDEFISNLVIEFQRDSSDRNTIQEFKGTEVQITTSLNSTVDKKLQLTNGLERVSIPFALGKRKTELSTTETVLKTFYDGVGVIINALVTVLNAIITAINALIRILNKFIKLLNAIQIKIKFQIKEVPKINIDTLVNPIDNRIGMLKMESDFVNVPKLIMIPRNSNALNNKLLSNNESVLNALYLFNTFHYYKSFIPQNGYAGNQFYLRKFDKIPFTFDDFDVILQNNKMFDFEGNNNTLLSLKFNEDEQTATGTYKQQKQYANNLIQTIYEPD